ncbi:MAG: GTP-binding protein YchF [Parcubacteria group bacterium GW2011_GWA2_36_10]|nr:MAG: GTP-binding protein YchF [Parcubacteria group bacterium GW2011_GWA2_36_10]
MSFSLGIVGLPNVGKSTLFQALTKNKVDAANYPFCTIDPNVGVVAVPDERLEKLSVMSSSAKIVATTIEFVDIAGLVKGASTGEGLGNKFLAHIRETDAIVQVVRHFSDSNVIHVGGKIDPEDDKQVINLELILADLETVTKHLSKVVSKMKGAYEKELDQEKVVITKAKDVLEQEKLLSAEVWSEKEFKILKQLNLLSLKPIIYLYNIAENDLGKDLNLPNNSLSICAKLEAELAELDEAEAQNYLQELGIKNTGLNNLIKTSYSLLNLITFITTGPEETKAWTITKGTKAPQAAGVIHTDFAKGFIRAEVINCHDLLKAGSWTKAKELGLMRMEGKEYVMQDGDTVHFYFN